MPDTLDVSRRSEVHEREPEDEPEQRRDKCCFS